MILLWDAAIFNMQNMLTILHGHRTSPFLLSAARRRPLNHHILKEMRPFMSYQSIGIQSDGPTALITLNRPQRRNALSLELMLELIDCLDAIGRDRAIRAVILAAAGKVFCSGHDLSEMVGRDINEYRRLFDVCSELMMKIQSIPQPVIAEVQGIATAAGCQLVATCDLAIASD